MLNWTNFGWLVCVGY